MKHLTISALILGMITSAVRSADLPSVVPQGSAVLLSLEEGFYMAPKWSSDGTRIAWTGSNYRGIYVYLFGKESLDTLSLDPAAGFGMQWSHGGERIVSRIASFEQKRRLNVLTVFDVKTGTRTFLTDYLTYLPGVPHWTQDDMGIFLSDTDTLRHYRVSSQTERNGSGNTFMYVKGNKIHQHDLVARTETVLEPVPGQVLNLTVSPDRTKMAFEIMGGHLWISDLEGRYPVNLGPGYSPDWNPESDRVTYMITQDDGHDFLSADIYVINADGTGKVNITKTPEILEMHPDWSPDGRWIAYDTYDKGQIMIQEVQ